MFMRSGKAKQTPESASRSPTSTKPTPSGQARNDIITLQKTYGNQAVQRMLVADIQRAEANVDVAKYDSGRGLKVNFAGGVTKESITAVVVITDGQEQSVPLGEIDFKLIGNTDYIDSMWIPPEYTSDKSQVRVDVGGAAATGDSGGTGDTADTATSDTAVPADTAVGEASGTESSAAAASTTSSFSDKIEQMIKDGAKDAVVDLLFKECKARHPQAITTTTKLKNADGLQLAEIAKLLDQYSVAACDAEMDTRVEFKNKVQDVF